MNYGLIGLGKVGTNVLRFARGIKFDWVVDSRRLWHSGNNKPLSQRDVVDLLKFKQKSTRLLTEEFHNAREERKLIESYMPEKDNWIVTDASHAGLDVSAHVNHMPHTGRVSSQKRNGHLYTKILKQCVILLGCIAFTLGSTFVLEVFVIAPILKSDRPLILRFYVDNHSINNITLRSKGTVDVSIVPSGNQAYVTSLRILISNQSVANAIWVVPGQDLRVSAFVSGQSEIFILGPSYGISWLTLATLPVLVTG